MTRPVALRAGMIAALAALVGLAIVVGGRSGSHARAAADPRPVVAHSSVTAAAPSPQAITGSPDADAPAPPEALSPATRPVRVQIPAIGVDSALQPLGITADGSLQSPSQWQRAGWYADGVRPGDTGPAVIAGHVDSVSGPAVFFRLGQLRPGDHVTVTRADGRRLVFVVDQTREYPKRAFPTEAVYGPTSLPVLRLVTCTGDFDAKAKSYVDNLVVTSHLIDS